jgi:hypothetical protein
VHPEQHERLLQQVLIGESTAEEPGFRQQLETCEECRRQVAQLGELQESLDRAAQEEQDVLQEVVDRNYQELPEYNVDAPLLRHIKPSVEAVGSAPRVNWMWFGMLAAALFFLFVLLRVLPDSASSSPPQQLLGPSVLECLHPVGKVEEFDTFRWRSASNGASYYEVVVRDPDSDQILLQESRIGQNQWTPTAEELRQLPTAIRWEVRACDLSGTRLRHAVASAAR